MNDPSARAATPTVDAPAQETPLIHSRKHCATSGQAAAIDRVDRAPRSRRRIPGLARRALLKARHELGLPLCRVGPLAELPEPARTQYEEKYVAAIRLVGSRHLDKGDIPTAWAYYRAIAESEPVAASDRRVQSLAENDERLGAIIEVAFNHGVSPRRGFELILEQYGTCPAISAFEQLPAHDEKVRAACAETLIEHLHGELTATSAPRSPPGPGRAAARNADRRVWSPAAPGSSPTKRTTSTSRICRPWCECP